MKKIILLFALCLCFVFVLSGCTEKFKRISFDDEALDSSLDKYIDADTEVLYNGKTEYPAQLPIYEISKRDITQDEFDQMLENLNLAAYAHKFDYEGNKIIGNWVSYTDRTSGYFEMSDEALEKLAWETFKKIPFLDGEYKYLGIKSNLTISDSEGTHVTRVGVSFRKHLNDLRILGNDRCILYFDARGLCEIVIETYDYKEIGTMDLVKHDEALSKIKTPDYFSLKNEYIDQTRAYDTLRTNESLLVWYNLFSKDCSILQPIYIFEGTASGTDLNDSEFTSMVIAVPESYTYK